MLLVLTLFLAQLHRLEAVEGGMTAARSHRKLVARAVLAVVARAVLAAQVLELQIKGLTVAQVMVAHSLRAVPVAVLVVREEHQSLMALVVLVVLVFLLQLLVHQ
jgi:hypothetical protein